jgi:hypothetical protein
MRLAGYLYEDYHDARSLEHKVEIGSLISRCLRRWKAADAALPCATNNSCSNLLNLDDEKQSQTTTKQSASFCNHASSRRFLTHYSGLVGDKPADLPVLSIMFCFRQE